MIKLYGVGQSRAMRSLWALLLKLDLSNTPNVGRWLGECCARPSFAKAQRG